MRTYLTLYLCKPEHIISKLMKKTPKEAYAKEIKHKIHSISNMFLTKQEVSKQDAMKRSLSIPMRHSDIDVQYVSAGLKKIN